MEAEPKLLLDKLVEQEEKLSQLYELFAQTFPVDREFWERMASEERMHASWIEKLRRAAVENVVFFSEGKLRLRGVETFLVFIDQCLDKARAGEVERSRSLRLAHDLEAALLEERVFDHFAGDTPKFAEVAEKMRRAIENHRQHLEAKIGTNRFPG